MLEMILSYLKSLGLAGLFIGVFIEALGLPFPGSVFIALAGFLCNQGKLNYVLAIAAALSGYLSGSTAAFLIGKHIGEPFLLRWGKYLLLTPARLHKAQHWLGRSAAAFIILGRFIPTAGNLTPYIAGLSKIKLVWFLIYDTIHALIWGAMFFGVGAFFGKEWPVMLKFLNGKLLWLVLAVVIIYIIYLIFKKERNLL